MSTPTRKLNFSPNTPRKRARTSGNLVIYRNPRFEMKKKESTIAHSSTTLSNVNINGLAQGNDSDQRNGTRVKIFRLEGLVRSTGDNSLRLTLYSPKIIDTELTASLEGPVNLDDFWVLKDWWLHAGTEDNNRGHIWSYKFPMGCISEYSGDSGNPSGQRKNRFILRIQSVASDTVNGYVRCWYTDH